MTCEEVATTATGTFVQPACTHKGAHVTFQHWQLRDLIACTKDREDDVFFITKSKVRRLSRRTKETSCLVDLSFAPVSMAAEYGFLACGSQDGDLSIVNLRDIETNDFEVEKFKLEGSINNAMQISRHAGDTRILISNNDRTIKVFSLTSMRVLNEIHAPEPVNYSSVSPDELQLCAVGDSTMGWIYDVRGGSYVTTHRFGVSWDAGFSCAWSADSTKIAVAAQEGYCRVWDTRSLKAPLHSFKSMQYPDKHGACRNVKFTHKSGVDMLVFSEDHNYIQVVDARDFSEVQTVRVVRDSEYSICGDITGISFSNDNASLFVGTVHHGIVEFDVDVVARRRFSTGDINTL